MFDRHSRYSTTPSFGQGSRFTGTRPRSIPPAQGVIEHVVTKHDRLDRLAANYYNDPRKWWLILDANPAIAFAGDLDMGQYDGEILVIPADDTRSRY